MTYFEIYGYDDNWDMGGDHRSPKLCIVKANSKEQAEEYAMTLTGFYSNWHGKGYVKEVNVIDLTENETLNNAIDATFRGAVLRLAEKLKQCSYCDNCFKDGKWHRYVFVEDIDETAKKFLESET